VSRFTPSGASEWGAALPTWLGMVGLIACFVVWALTPDHIVEPLFVTTFGGLLAVGAGALDTLKQPPVPPIPPGDPPPLLDGEGRS
jgi:hypothetical protein